MRLPMLVFLMMVLEACAPGSRIVTKGEFKNIRPGMTYEQVVEVFGATGRRIAPGERVLGAIVPEDGGDSIVYLWQNADGSNVSASFSRFGLETWAQRQL